MSFLALVAMVSSGADGSRAGLWIAPAKEVVIQNARIVVKPGKTIERGNIVLRDGKIVSVGAKVDPGPGVEVVDGTGMTAYAAFIHPQLSSRITGISPAAGGGGGFGGGGGGGGTQSTTDAAAAMRARDADPFGRAGNMLLQHSLKEAKDVEVTSMLDLAKSGYALANLSATGGIIGSESLVYSTANNKPDMASGRDSGVVSIRLGGRGFGGYPGSTMGVIAFARQALADAKDYKAGTDNPAVQKLSAVTKGEKLALFEDVNGVTYFQAQLVAQEFGVKPIYSFRGDVGSVLDLVKVNGAKVFLRGTVPSRPTIGADIDTVSIMGVRNHINEMQAGSTLEKAKVGFSYAPATTTTALDGIRSYVKGGLSKNAALASLTTEPAAVLGLDDVGTIEEGKRANITLVQGDVFDSSSQVMATFVDGERVDFKMPEKKKPEDLKPDAVMKLPKPNYDVFPKPAETTAAHRLYRNATVWTQGPKGKIENCDVLIQGGKIVQVGQKLTAPSGCQVIDATGKHISPGIWDAHSHTGISGSVNEGSNMVTIECRIRDVINPTDSNIYVQLSGGTVGANQLHGSANAIGGQNSVVKWRWGMRPTDFPVAGAPEGVKFALGQNPIREDAGGGTPPPVGSTLLTFRPRTRMGVEESIRRALQLGKEYNQSWADFRSGKSKVQPRRDLQLEGLGEIVSGKRLVHSHGYRADEMLMLLRVVKEYGGTIATLQHVLEGYKIADEMAEQGVGGSTFSDWWGYKLEAYDAIPHNAALMDARGVSVSVNSDSDNHARRLNIEGAKSMRYGGVSAEKALSFVTLEPAKQLGIADHTGSLEVGKDADMAVWSEDPTSIYAVCLETYVDGIKRFDRANDAVQRAAREKEILAAKTALGLDAPKVDPNSPFTTGGESNTNANVDSNGGASTAKFGVGPLLGQPGTARYPRPAVLIAGATVHPMSKDPFIGDVLIGADGKIIAVGKVLEAPSSNLVRVDGTGKHLYPGMIDPATGIGLNEIGQIPASDDSSERGNFHPDYRAERVINPEWETMAVARNQGILTVVVKPSGAGIPGQAALIHTEGYTWEDMTIQGGLALAFTPGGGGGRFGVNEVRFDDSKCCGEHDQESHDHDEYNDEEFTSGKGLEAQQQPAAGSSMDGLTAQLTAARDYAKLRSEATAEKPVPVDQRQEAMLKVANGEMPVLISANSASDMKAAVAWAEKENVKIMLYGCSSAGEIIDWLAEKQVPICLAAVYGMPRTDQPVDYFYNLPARLAKAGVKFCLTTNDDKDTRQLRDQAGWAAAYGMNREDAARSITYWTAQVMGIEDRLGSIQVGLDGTVIMTDGDLLETKTQVLRAWIQGREVDLASRQTRLYDKYKARPIPGLP